MRRRMILPSAIFLLLPACALIFILAHKQIDAYIYLSSGNKLAERDKYVEALQDFTKAIESRPKYAEAYANRGCCQLNLKQWEPAQADFRKAVALDAKNSRAHSGLGRYYCHQGNQAAAFFELNIAIAYSWN